MRILKPSLLSKRVLKLKYISPNIIQKHFIHYLGNWEKPTGTDTGITVYNSSAKEKVPLILEKKDFATWYMCGPTVYAESHIGHASCYVKFDIIRRILENVFNINVLVLLGITDIDDKIIKKCNEMGISASTLAKKYELDFFQDMETMRVLPPSVINRVSENIPFIISFCEELIKKEYAYVTNDGNVYFMVSKSVTAEVLHEIPDEILQEQKDPLKQDPRDFAVWKAAKPNEPFWESPWGKGRPGWHIECSVMASKMFGSKVDLHSGGYDLLFPHHSNEVSQSKAYHGCSQWVNYWLHSGLLHVDDENKMSKSLGNTISIKDFLKEHSVNDFRLLCLQSRYRKNLPYNAETLSGAKALHKKFHNFINESEAYISGELKGPLMEEEKLLSKLAATKEQVVNFLRNDFNTSKALLCLSDFIDDINKSIPTVHKASSVIPSSVSTIANCSIYINKILEIFGISVKTKKQLPKEIVYSLDSITEFRNKVRLLALNPKFIGTGVSLKSYVDDEYRDMKVKLNMIYQPKEIPPKLILKFVEECKTFYEKTSHVAEVLDSDKSLELPNQMTSKERKKKMAPIFTVCDEFRSVLEDEGIIVKDRGDSSSWIPSLDLQKNL